MKYLYTHLDNSNFFLDPSSVLLSFPSFARRCLHAGGDRSFRRKGGSLSLNATIFASPCP